MKIRLGHVVAYMLGLSSSAWIDLLHELPPRLRVALESALALLPFVVVGIILLPPIAAVASRAVVDRLVSVAIVIGSLYWFATIAWRMWRRKPIPLAEWFAFWLVLLIVGGKKKRVPTAA